MDPDRKRKAINYGEENSGDSDDSVPKKKKPTKAKSPKKPKLAKPEGSPIRKRRSRKRIKKNDEGEDDEHLIEIFKSREKRTNRHQLLADELEVDPELEYREEGGNYVGDIWIPPKAAKLEPPLEGVRLIIEKIICENFKSYAGVKELGPFHKSFSAIIGPNGNGKSNIIDAMLFVFGYRASKLRSKKLSVLIHNSDLLSNVEYCSVTVVFGKILDDGITEEPEIIANSRITVQRIVNKNNASSYYLNERRVQFQDVATFLNKKGIDIVHNRFLILQGEVETIAQMKPKSPNGQEPGLLEYLEDIIGTRRYIKSLGLLEARVEELDCEREDKLKRVDLVEKEKNAMEEPVRKAKEYLRNQNSKIRFENQYYQAKIRDFSKKLADSQTKKNELEFELGNLTKRIAEIEELNANRKAEFEKSDKNWKKLEKEYSTKGELLRKNLENFEKYKSNLKHANDLRKKTKEEITNIETELVNIEDLPKKNEHEIQKLDKRKDELKDLIKEEQDKIREPLEELRIKSEKIKIDLEEAKNTLSLMKRKYAEINKRHDASLKDLTTYKDVAEKESSELEKRYQDLIETKKELEEKENQGRSSAESIDPLFESLQRKQQENAEITQKYNLINRELSNVQSKYNEAKENVEGFKSNDGAYKCFLLENKIRGVYGRFKDLAKIDESYNVAATISTSFLDYWIVDNDSTASICINLLKQKKLPFQNFICLNKCRNEERSMNEPFNCPSGAKRIFDLMDISKAELRPVFYKAFRNTLVCEDIDSASRVAFYGSTRHRVATLKGEIINPSGSMVGGGFKKIQGAFNTGMSKQLEQKDKFSQEDVKSLKKHLESIQQEYDDVTFFKSKINEEEYQLNNQLKKLMADSQFFQSDLNSLKAQIPLKEKRWQEQKKRAEAVKIDEKILELKESAYEALKNEKEEFEGPYEEKIDQVKDLTSNLREYQDTRRKRLEETVNKYTTTLKKVEEERRKKVIEIKNIENNKKRLQDKKQRLGEEIEKIQNEMLELAKLKKDIEVGGEELALNVKQILIERDAAKEERDKLKLTLEELSPEKKKAMKRRAVAELDLTKFISEVETFNNKLKGFNESFEVLQLKGIPDEEVEPLELYTDEVLSTIKFKDLEHQIQKLEQKLQKDIPNLQILDEFRKKVELFIERVKEFDEVTGRRDMYRDAYLRTTVQRVSEFMEAYSRISAQVKELFRMISLGGDAELDLVDHSDPFSGGIIFRVRPTAKSWKKISHLSGGEKTLSSLALVFALHYFKPSPFYILDEIDAALDFKNVSIIANYIKDRTKFTQFIVISLRSNMFELADCLFGVYKVDSMSYCLHFQMKSFLAKLQGLIKERSRRLSSSSSKSGSGGRTPIKQTLNALPNIDLVTSELFNANTPPAKDPVTINTNNSKESPKININPSAITQLQQSQNILKESDSPGPQFREERGQPSYFALNTEAQRAFSQSSSEPSQEISITSDLIENDETILEEESECDDYDSEINAGLTTEYESEIEIEPSNEKEESSSPSPSGGKSRKSSQSPFSPTSISSSSSQQTTLCSDDTDEDTVAKSELEITTQEI